MWFGFGKIGQFGVFCLFILCVDLSVEVVYRVFYDCNLHVVSGDGIDCFCRKRVLHQLF